MTETSVYNLGGTKRLILFGDDRLVFETAPGIKMEFEYIGEDVQYYIYMPPIVKHKFLGCIYSYSIDQRRIRISKYDLFMEYTTKKRSCVYKME